MSTHDEADGLRIFKSSPWRAVQSVVSTSEWPMKLVPLSIGLALLGLLFFCVGYLPALGWISGAWVHLLAQWYERYLSLGGEPVMFSDDEIIEATLRQT